MNSKEYYKVLLGILHESDAADAINGEMEGTPNDPAAGQPEDGSYESATADENLEGLDDASYMDAPVDPALDDITQRQRNTKLFDCFSELQNTIEYFIESLGSRVSLDLIDSKQTEVISFIKDRLKKLIEKLVNYQQNSFIARRYEENLYMFMLLRSEFLTAIKYIRTTLKITNNTEKNKKIIIYKRRFNT